jgi:hypothetical protein
VPAKEGLAARMLYQKESPPAGALMAVAYAECPTEGANLR